jgi:small-conductance mechanosensitive channel
LDSNENNIHINKNNKNERRTMRTKILSYLKSTMAWYFMWVIINFILSIFVKGYNIDTLIFSIVIGVLCIILAFISCIIIEFIENRKIKK